MASASDLQAAIAVTRFGMGARPGEIASVGGDAKGWLKAQIRPAGADQPAPNAETGPETAADRIKAFRVYQQDRQAARRAADTAEPAKPGADPVRMAGRMLRDGTAEDFLARARLGATTSAGFRERWALFWCNHFTVSGIKLVTATVVGPYELEAIRPHVFGRFEDLLLASSSHPGMLLYLDQAQSIGPGSPQMQRRGAGGGGRQRAGLNENLAREILELHTVGVDGGYSQADVTDFARALTGWSVGSLREAEDRQGRYVFRTAAHEPGARTVMGKTYRNDGAEQGAAILRDLAAHKATARHLSRKIAAHFVADTPPPALVARLEQAWLGSGGDLAVVAEALIDAPEAWDPAPAKLKTPYEFLISSWRCIGGRPGAAEHLTQPLNGMGQRAYSAPSPKGWPDEASTWAAPDALVKRMIWTEGFSAVTAAELDTNAAAAGALGARLSPTVQKAVARAESREEALSILLMSPEFQRR